MAAPKTLPKSVAASAIPHVKKEVNPEKLAAEIKAGLGINLVGQGDGSTTHGHISTLRTAGWSVTRACDLCEDTVPANTPHACVEVVLYDAAGVSDVSNGAGGRPLVSHAPHGLSTAQKAQLQALVNAHRP